MVTNSDLQIWQDAVKGINESGRNDLIAEEWSALEVLNSCLSNGNFQSVECHYSYQKLNDNLNRHDNNPDLNAHLYNYIALCYKYATENQTSATPVTSVSVEEPSIPCEYRQPVKTISILFGTDGQFKQSLLKNLKLNIIYVFVAATIAGIIYALCIASQMNMPGYVTALVVGALTGCVVLQKNQNGTLREKIAFLGATVAGIWMYFLRGGQISGGYAFAGTFVGTGFLLIFVEKSKPKTVVWLAEVIPAVLCFLAFERLGGAISGFGAKEMIWGNFVSVRYVEAFKIFLLFCLFQSFANNAVTTQYRKKICSVWRKILFYGLQGTIILFLLFMFINPFILPVFDSVKSELIAFSQPVSAGADVLDTNGNKIGSATKTPISSVLLSEHIPGYLAIAYDFHYDGGFDTARITFRYDAGLGLISENFQPRIYYYNENDGTFEELPDQIVYTDYNGGWSSVTAKTTHFSTYILLNKVEQDAWRNTEIRRPPAKDPCPCGSSAAVSSNADNFDVVFVIDESGSMSQNDPNRLRVEAAKQFIDMLEADSKSNRAAIYGFEASARTILNLTNLNDKEATKTSLNSIRSGGGTNIYSGLAVAVQEIETKNHSSYTPVIILMTDGQDNSVLTNYTPLIDRANAKGITVFAIGLGNDVNATLLRQICDNTGGGVYYYAENAEVLPFIFKSVKTAIIDYDNDSNGDGISDYYSQMLYDGTLRLSNGSAQFKGADFLISNKADFDGDGFKNGEELVVKSIIIHGVEQVCLTMRSDPTKKNSVPTEDSSANNYFTYSGGDIANGKVADYTTDYIFSTEYFKEDANIYNHDLSIMSLQLAMAAFGLHKEPYGITKANNLRCLLSCMGFKDIIPYGYESKPKENTIAAIIAKMSLNNKDELLVIAVRGGEYKDEWGGNFNVGNGDVHEGFRIAKEKVMGYFDSYLRTYRNELTGKNVKLWITGYSRGSAVANLLGAHFIDKVKNDNNYASGTFIDNNNTRTQVEFSLKRTDIYTYCFATPNVSKKAEFAYENSNYDNIFCIINPFDFVPRFPFRKWGFKKYGTIISLPSPKYTNYKHLEEKMLDKLESLNSSFDANVYMIDTFRVHKGNTGHYYTSTMLLSPAINLIVDNAIYDLGPHNGKRKDETMDEYLDHLISITLYNVIGLQDDYVNKMQSTMINIVINAMGDGGRYIDLPGIILAKISDVVGNIIFSGENNDDIATLGPSPEHLKRLLYDDANVGRLPFECRFPAVYNFGEGSSDLNLNDGYDIIMREKGLKTRKEAIKEGAKEANNNLKSLFSGHYPELYLAWLKTVRYNSDAIKVINEQQKQK